MSSTEQNAFDVADRRKLVAALYLKGKYQSEIAAECGVTQQQISSDLKQIRKAWLEAGIRDFDAIKSEQLAKLDVLEITYWQAWEASDSRVNSKGDRLGADPRYLAGVESVIDKRCRIFGFYAPTKINVTEIDAALEKAWLEHVGVESQSSDAIQ